MADDDRTSDALLEEIEILRKRLDDLEEIEKLYEALFNRTNDAVFLINLDGTHKKVNKRACEMLGYDREEIVGQQFSLFLDEGEIGKSLNIKERLYSGESFPIYERIYKRKSGSTFCGENDVSLVRDSHGDPSFFFSIVRDISERKEIQKKLEELADTDHLTGLLNRRSMTDKLKEEILRYERWHHPFTLLLLDIDHFKAINDIFGHDGGDYVLREISKKIESSCRQLDLCCRWGGEEFLIMLPETDLHGGEVMGEKIRSKIASLKLHHRDNSIDVTATIGIAEFDGATLEDCIRNADNALYEGKKAGRNRIVLA